MIPFVSQSGTILKSLRFYPQIANKLFSKSFSKRIISIKVKVTCCDHTHPKNVCFRCETPLAAVFGLKSSAHLRARCVEQNMTKRPNCTKMISVKVWHCHGILMAYRDKSSSVEPPKREQLDHSALYTRVQFPGPLKPLKAVNSIHITAHERSLSSDRCKDREITCCLFL